MIVWKRRKSLSEIVSEGLRFFVASIVRGLWIIWAIIASMMIGAFGGGWEELKFEWEKSRSGVISAILIAIAIIAFWPHNEVRETSTHKPTAIRQGSEQKAPETISRPTADAPTEQAQIVVPSIPQPKMPIVSKVKGPLNGVLVIIDPGHGGMTRWQTPDPGCFWMFKSQELRESAYTYRMAKEVTDSVLLSGGDVVYTAWSPTMNVVTAPSSAMPLPIKALLPDGAVLVNGATGLNQRVVASNRLYRATEGKYKLVVFISLHVDAEGPGQSGLHVCYDRHSTPPRLAELMERSIINYQYGWRNGGQPMSTLKPQELYVLNGKYNVLMHRVLLECGIPGNPRDSWRLRSEPHRRAMLERVVVEPLLQLAKEQKGGG